MDKQEVINEIEKIDYQNLKYNSPERMLSEQKQLIIDIIEQFDEPMHDKCYEKMADYEKQIGDLERQIEEMENHKPQKVKVPAFVAEWFEENKHNLNFAIYELCEAGKVPVDLYEGLTDFERWFYLNHDIDTLIRMQDGYEVEEETKWVVKSNRLYFTGITQLIARDPITYNFTTDENRAHVFDDKESAEKEASFFNGTVEQVEV